MWFTLPKIVRIEKPQFKAVMWIRKQYNADPILDTYQPVHPDPDPDKSESTKSTRNFFNTKFTQIFVRF